MNWMWIAALVWIAVALPVGMLTGIYLRRLDRQEASEQASDPGATAELPAGNPPSVAPRTRAARRRGRPWVPGALAHSVRPSHDVRDTPPAPGADDQGDGPAGPRPTSTADRPDPQNRRTPAGARGRPPLYRHR